MSRLASLFALMALSSALFNDSLVAQDSDQGQTEAKKSEKKEADRYTVPAQATVAELTQFINNLVGYRPTNALEQQLHRRRLPGPLKKAAEMIVKAEKDTQSNAYGMARGILFELRIAQLNPSEKAEHAKLIDDMVTYFKVRKRLSGYEVTIARAAADQLAQAGNEKQAAVAYQAFAQRFTADSNPQLVAQAASLLAAARRVNLVGNVMKLKGTTTDGKEFDLDSLKGKVVLVDFWATWCRPCVEEYPNILRQYEKYHSQGFEVVGISLDQNRFRLSQYLSEKKVPWMTLHDADPANRGMHPVAEYYDIRTIPRMIVVGRDGKVLSLQARGKELQALLAKQFTSKKKSNKVQLVL